MACTSAWVAERDPAEPHTEATSHVGGSDRSTPAARAAVEKKKKKAPLTATVNGTFTIRQNNPGGFGNDNGPNWQQLNVVIKDAKIPFRAPNRQSAAASVLVSFQYEAEAHI